MAKRNKRPQYRGVVLLLATDVRGDVVIEDTLDIVNYYEQLHPMIDSADYRRQRGIRQIRGRIFDYSGDLDQEFFTEYSADGAMTHQRAAHADGTIVED